MARIPLAPPRPRRLLALARLLALPIAATLFASPALAQSPPPAPRTASQAIAANDRAALRAETAVAHRLAHLDEVLALGTFPDDSPLWPARLVASIEAGRLDGSPARDLLRRLAVELRGLGGNWTLGGRPDEPPGARPAASAPAGRERAERIFRIGELLALIERKLGVRASEQASSRRDTDVPAQDTGSPPANRIDSKYGTDSCFAATVLSLGGNDGGSTQFASSDGRSSCDGPSSGPDLWFRFTAPSDGPYSFTTVSDYYDPPFDTVISLHSGCPLPDDDRELACNDDFDGSLLSSISRVMTAGDSVWVRVTGYDGATGRFDLTVTLDRTVRGTVVEEPGGAPIEGATVEILDWFGYRKGETTTAADGSYAAGVSAQADLRARANHPEKVSQLYDGIDCPAGSFCSAYSADPISVADGDASDIDFALGVGGTISGTAMAADTGGPLVDDYGNHVYVNLYDTTGTFLQSSVIDEHDGSWRMGSIAPGSYYVSISAYQYVSEVWNDEPCSSTCDPLTGDPIVVGAGETVGGIDFVLDRLGEIRGRVTDDATGDPVGSGQIRLHDTSGTHVRTAYLATDGTYAMPSVSGGEYFVRTETPDHVDELYDDHACEGGCTATVGNRVAVGLNDPTEGIDFALTRKATLSGVVIDRQTREPIQGADIDLYDSSGEWVARRYLSYSSEGGYEFRGLDAGTYFVRAGWQPWNSYYSHNGELYDDVPCQPECDPTTGTPVVVPANSPVTGIDFELDRLGSIAGTVVHSATGQPIEISVSAYDLDGHQVAYNYTDADGHYEIADLPDGSYRIQTQTGSSYSSYYRPERYPNLPCGSTCDPGLGTPVAVTATHRVSGIDFSVERLGRIHGTVYSTNPGDAVEARVDLLDASGVKIRTSDNDYSASYELTRLFPGTYYLVARQSGDGTRHQDELFPDVPCEPDCDVSQGTPIVVGLETFLTGVDFELSPCPGNTHEEIAGTTISGYAKAVACERVTLDDVLLGAGADLVVRTGRSAVFGDAFSMEPGARLRVVIEPDWADD